MDMKENEDMKKLYLDNEKYDGYIRDKCVFSDQIDIEDSMNVLVEYQTGAKMTYSLNAFCPWEGFMVNFNGSQGRLEHYCQESVYINGDGSVPGELIADQTTIKVFPHFKTGYPVDVWTGEGGHGGGDPVLLADLFSSNPPKDKYLRKADQRSGAYSILTGVAANKSMATGKSVEIDDLVQNIGMPDYPVMPDSKTPLIMHKPDVKLTNPEEALKIKAEQEKK